MKHIIVKLTLQPILVFTMITIILFFNMCSIVDGNEFNDRFEFDIEKRYFIDDQINLQKDIKSLGLKIEKLNFEVNF